MLYKIRKLKSWEESKYQKLKLNQWLVEDKSCWNLNISIASLDAFLSGDFELRDNNNQKEVFQIPFWNEIETKRENQQHSFSPQIRPLQLHHSDDNQNNNEIEEESKTNGIKIHKDYANTPLNNQNEQQSNQMRSPGQTKVSNNLNATHSIIWKNKIWKIKENLISLRSLSLICEIDILMSGESTFYIFSRSGDKFTSTTALCYISKELESARKFVSFAILESCRSIVIDNNEISENNDIIMVDNESFIIRNWKKQEIPRQENYIKALDISEIKFTFVDNGDNKCFVFLHEQEQNSNLIFIGDFYVPVQSKCNIKFGVTGDLISLKKLKVKQAVRNSILNWRSTTTNSNVQACNCCSLF